MGVGNSIFITARIEPKQWRPETNELRIGRIEFLSDIKDKKLQRIIITARLDQLCASTVNDLTTLLAPGTGSSEILFKIFDVELQSNITLKCNAGNINISKTLVDYIENNEALSLEIS